MIVDKAEDFIIPFQVKNNEGGIINITSATITCNIKETSISSLVTIQKVSTDSAQIEKTYSASGLGIVKILAANTSSLLKRHYYYEIISAISSDTYKQYGFITFRQNTDTSPSSFDVSGAAILHGTTAERVSLGLQLTSADRIDFYDDDQETPYWWSGTEWT